MNGYERISAALNGEYSDKVPIMLHNFMMAAREAGVSMEEFRSDPVKMAEAFSRSVEKYGFDGIVVDLDTATLAGAAGVPVDFPGNEPARTRGSFLTSVRDAGMLKGTRIEHYKYVVNWLEAVRILKQRFGDSIFIRGNCDQAPFSLACMIRGMDGFMVDLVMSPEEWVFELLEYTAEITGQFIRLMAQTGADMVSNGDSPAGPELLSPELYRKFALPYEKKMADTAHELGLPYGLHICGNTDLILDSMVTTGVDALELDYKTDPGLVRKALAGKITFIGNIDPSGVLALGTPEKIRNKARELLEMFGNENRYILNAGCAIPAGTPGENLAALIRAGRDFR